MLFLVSAIQQNESALCKHTSPLFRISFPFRSPQGNEWSSLCYRVGSHSVQFRRSVMTGSLQPHGLQHARLPCPPPNPGACSNSCPSSLWCHPTISSSVIPFSSCLQSFPASGSFQISQLFRSGGQNIGVLTPASVLPVNIQDWSPLGGTGCIFLAVQGTLKSLLQHHSSKASVLRPSASFTVLSHPYMTTGKTITMTRQTFEFL